MPSESTIVAEVGVPSELPLGGPDRYANGEHEHAAEDHLKARLQERRVHVKRSPTASG
jgi:hypothetical protein